MTERTIRSMAKELAGRFYEDVYNDLNGERYRRTDLFRQTYPTLRDYMRGIQHLSDGTTRIDKPGWVYHIAMAKRVLVEMLNRPEVTPIMKERIYDALLEEHDKATSIHAKSVAQRSIMSH